MQRMHERLVQVSRATFWWILSSFSVRAKEIPQPVTDASRMYVLNALGVRLVVHGQRHLLLASRPLPKTAGVMTATVSRASQFYNMCLGMSAVCRI